MGKKIEIFSENPSQNQLISIQLGHQMEVMISKKKILLCINMQKMNFWPKKMKIRRRWSSMLFLQVAQLISDNIPIKYKLFDLF